MLRITLILLFISIECLAVKIDSDSVDTAISKINDDSIKIRMYIMASYDHQYTETPDYSKVKYYHAKAMELAEKHKWQWAIYRCNRLQGNWGSLRGDYHDALKYDKIGLELAIAFDSTKVSMAMADLADDYINLGNYSLAYYYTLRALQLSYDSLDVVVNQLNIGIIYKEVGEYKKAYQQIRAAQMISEQYDDYEGMAYAYLELGDIYILLNNKIQAFKNLEAAMQYSNRYDIIQLIPEIHLKLGESYTKFNDLEKAKLHYDSALTIYAKYLNQSGEIMTAHGVAKLYIKQERYKDAELLLNLALEMATKTKNTKLKIEILQTSVEMYRKIGDEKKLASHIEQYSDEVLEMHNSNLIDEMHTIKEVMESDISISREQPEIISADKSKSTITVSPWIIDAAIMTFWIVVISLLFVAFYKLRIL